MSNRNNNDYKSEQGEALKPIPYITYYLFTLFFLIQLNKTNIRSLLVARQASMADLHFLQKSLCKKSLQLGSLVLEALKRGGG